MYVCNKMKSAVHSLQTQLVEARHSSLGSQWCRRDTPQLFGRMYLLESGSCILKHHGRTFHLRPGVLHVIPPYTALDYRCPDRMTIDWCHFRAHVLGGMDLFAYWNCGFEYRPVSVATTRTKLLRLQQLVHVSTEAAAIESAGLLLELLAPFADLPRKARSADSDRMTHLAAVIERIDNNPRRPLSVEELAAGANLSRGAFTRVFRSQFGISPARFIRRKRIERAQRMLLETDATLAELAEALGFVDGFHLSKAFKAITGVSPSQFRADRPELRHAVP